MAPPQTRAKAAAEVVAAAKPRELPPSSLREQLKDCLTWEPPPGKKYHWTDPPGWDRAYRCERPVLSLAPGTPLYVPDTDLARDELTPAEPATTPAETSPAKPAPAEPTAPKVYFGSSPPRAKSAPAKPTTAKPPPAKPPAAKAEAAKSAPAEPAPAKATSAKLAPAEPAPAKATSAKPPPAEPAPAKSAPRRIQTRSLAALQPTEEGSSPKRPRRQQNSHDEPSAAKLFFGSSPPRAKSAPAEAPSAKPPPAEPAPAKATAAKPTPAEPAPAKATAAKPPPAEPPPAKPAPAKATSAKPPPAKPASAKATAAKPPPAKATAAKPPPADPATAEPAPAKSAPRRILTRSLAALQLAGEGSSRKRPRRQQNSHDEESGDSTDEQFQPSGDEQSSQSLQESRDSTDRDSTDEQSQHSTALDDDGTRRCRLQHTILSLSCVAEALEAGGQELDAETIQGMVKPRRVRNKKGDQVRRGRGLAKPAEPAPPSARPKLKVVRDCEFATSPRCTKVKSTIRLLTVENMPGPYRSYTMFPVADRLNILRKFLQRYAWGPGEIVRRCLDVYEAIAANVYTTELTAQRSKCKEKYGDDKEEWKKHPPCWCRNVQHWKGLCDIWAKEKWVKNSSINRQNMTKKGPIVHHVGGSRSTYQHMESLKSKLGKEGGDVGLKDLFDATHTMNTPDGRVYVNEKAKKTAELFDDLRAIYGPEITDEAVWEEVVGGEKRGRLFGLGKRSRVSKKTLELELKLQSELSPTRSTTTTAASLKNLYSREDVDDMLAAQEMRHKAQLEELRRNDEYNKACIQMLLQATGTNPPALNKQGHGEQEDAAGKQGDVGGAAEK